jgi:hypothetical protein
MVQNNFTEAENTDAELRMKKIEEINLRKDDIKKQAENFVEEFDKLLFPFGSIDTLEIAITFLAYNAKWKYSEAMFLDGALTELEEIHEKLIEDKDTNKQTIVNLPNRILDTLNYFLNKTEGQGLTIDNNFSDDEDVAITFDSYLELFKAVQDGLKIAEPKRRELKTFEKKMEIANHMIQSWQHGIDPGDMISEFEEELVKELQSQKNESEQ